MKKYIWQTITGLGVIIALITSIIGLDSRYVTAAEVTQSIQQLQKQFQIQMDYNRLGSLKQQRYAVSRELRNDPENVLLKDEQTFLEKEISTTEDRLRKNTVGE